MCTRMPGGDGGGDVGGGEADGECCECGDDCDCGDCDCTYFLVLVFRCFVLLPQLNYLHTPLRTQVIAVKNYFV